MNKILVTGLAIGTETGVCQVCNYDFDWIFRFPSTLIWADKILVPNLIRETINNEVFPDSKEIAKSLRLIIEMAESHGLIEAIDTKSMFTKRLTDYIYEQIENDYENLQELYPDKVKIEHLGDSEKAPTELVINGYGYCPAHIWTIYAGYILSRALNANCFLSPSVAHFSHYKFASTLRTAQSDIDKIESFVNVFEIFLPNEPLLPMYAIQKEGQCSMCIKLDECKDTYLSRLEDKVKSLLLWRDYDETQQIKEVVERIISKRDSLGDSINPKEVLSEFQETQNRLRRRVRSLFPKVNRWANISTMLSISIAVLGVTTGSSLFTIAGATGTGLSQITKELMQLLQSKYRWLGFTPKLINKT